MLRTDWDLVTLRVASDGIDSGKSDDGLTSQKSDDFFFLSPLQAPPSHHPSAAGHTPRSSSATASLRRGSYTTRLRRSYEPSISNAASPPPPPPKGVTCARALEWRRFMCRFTE
uniref:Uncharacterized protein n=1 Tax=Ananas comosus var. bracteatus TaxID=296719 RepID=A0A6V7NIW1_ANACO|nr:unnamed protein product [Ananas comosus var. bracteatus]